MDEPNSDSTWPTARSFDPSRHRAKARATVAALRAEATHVDITVKSMGRRKAEAGGGALSAKLASVAAKGAADT